MSPKTVKMIDEIIEDLSEIEGLSFNQNLTIIPTGIDLLDTIAGGGIPAGKLISIAGAPGGGKCLAKGTLVLMYDGTIKNVEDIVIGDVVMGDDSTPRNVLATTSGTDEMYEVKPSRGDSYTVNSKHILSLKYINRTDPTDNNNGSIVDINVIDFINSTEEFKTKYLGYRVNVEFSTYVNIEKPTVLHTPLTVTPVGVGEYYGFQIDGNQRFLLGDFTVTHNSTLAVHVAAGFQKHHEQAMAFYIDSEQAMSYDRLASLGCDLDRTLLISEVVTLESVCKIIEKIIQYKIKKKLVDVPFVFIWDSESASPTEKQLTTDDPAKIMGFKARLLSHMLPKITMDCNKYNITPILINQLRDKITMNMYQADVGGLRGMGDKTITGGNVMKFLPFQLILIRPRENIEADKLGFSGVVSEVRFVKNKNYIPHIKIDLVLDYMRGYSDFWTKQRLLQNLKAIKGTAWQYLENCKDKKFRKRDIETMYLEDDEFKEKFEELYASLKGEVTQAPEADEIRKGLEAEIDEEDELVISETETDIENLLE